MSTNYHTPPINTTPSHPILEYSISSGSTLPVANSPPIYTPSQLPPQHTTQSHSRSNSTKRGSNPALSAVYHSTAQRQKDSDYPLSTYNAATTANTFINYHSPHPPVGCKNSPATLCNTALQSQPPHTTSIP
ncbi:hypothetical protein L873DRAFT_1818544 [Choiromyces venosus 120613-1]|uniref:Uncharacterized protein n=1 Tax=Choiromyces venosus 120613-1 TaxID=1336337 RepID=A0A3N4J0Y4_9PEZI|nr:hypothetical protein L873DRAFT_1818544 [Choiromyces venosus 120613-1]